MDIFGAMMASTGGVNMAVNGGDLKPFGLGNMDGKAEWILYVFELVVKSKIDSKRITHCLKEWQLRLKTLNPQPSTLKTKP